MNEEQEFVLPMGLLHSSWCLPRLNTQRSNSRFILSSINLPDTESQKSNFQLRSCQNYTAAPVLLIEFLQISHCHAVENNCTCPIRGSGPQGSIQSTGDQFPRDV